MSKLFYFFIFKTDSIDRGRDDPVASLRIVFYLEIYDFR